MDNLPSENTPLYPKSSKVPNEIRFFPKAGTCRTLVKVNFCPSIVLNLMDPIPVILQGALLPTITVPPLQDSYVSNQSRRGLMWNEHPKSRTQPSERSLDLVEVTSAKSS